MRQLSSQTNIRLFLVTLFGLLIFSFTTGCSDAGPDASDRPAIGSPEAKAERFAWGERMLNCIHEKGWVDFTFEPVFEMFSSQTMTPVMAEAYKEDFTVCAATPEVGSNPNDFVLTEEIVEEIYDHHVKMRGCLEDLGFSTSQPPSKEQYIENYLSDSPSPWSPYVDLPRTLSYQERLEVFTACPQN